MRKRASGSGLFLTELILVILFFSITAAVYVQVFVGAHTVSKDSMKLTEATLVAQNLAEAFYGCEGDIDRIGALFPNSDVKENTLTISYDAYWEVYPKDRADVANYCAVLTVDSADDEMEHATVSVMDNDKDRDEIYSLELVRWTGRDETP